jgi:hypothetical protein
MREPPLEPPPQHAAAAHSDKIVTRARNPRPLPSVSDVRLIVVERLVRDA